MSEVMMSNGSYSLVFLLVVGFVFYLSSQIQDETSLQLIDTSGAITYIIKNLKKTPINDLKLIPLGQDCPEDYEEEPIGNFSGTVEACWNPQIYTYSQLTACTRHSIEITISEINATSLLYWKGQKFCSLRLSQSYIEANNCSASYRKCGNLLCVANDEDCPITFIEISKDNKGRITSYSTANDELSNNHLLFLDISINKKPCISEFLWPLSFAMNTTLPLIRKPVGCEVTDTNSQELDSMPGLTFFSQYPDLKNNISQKPLVGESLYNERLLLVARNTLTIQKTSNINFCMSLSKQDPKTFEAPLLNLQMISINFKWHSFWFLALGTGTALFTIFANHVLKYIVAFSTTLIFYNGAVLWQLWTLSVTKQQFKSEMEFIQQIGVQGCFENELLNEFLFRRFANIWEVSEVQQDQIGNLWWISLTLCVLSLGLVFWVWRQKKSAVPEVVYYRELSPRGSTHPML